MSRTLAEEFALEQERHWRRFVHATRPRGPMTMAEAMEFCARLDGSPLASKGQELLAEAEHQLNRIGKDLAKGD